jgi:3-hydroxyisobutyrate dehydrogenase
VRVNSRLFFYLFDLGTDMANLKQHKLGWIGIGRMGSAMAERLAKAGCDISVWNRTKSKAEPLAKCGAKVVDNLTDLAGCDIVFTMVSTGKDVKEVLFGPNGVTSKGGAPKIVVDSTSISLAESAEIRKKLSDKKMKMLAAPVSGNAKVIKAGKLTVVVSGPKEAFDVVSPYLEAIGRGVSYVGDGELSRIAKICHNVMLGVVIQNLCEITVLAEKAGMQRDGIDVHGLQNARIIEPRLSRNIHARTVAQGHRSWLGCGQRIRRADAYHVRGARHGADADWSRL